MRYFAGTWSCFGAQPDSVFGAAHEVQTLAVAAYDLGGHWMSFRFTELRTGDNDNPSTGVYQYGYDTAANQYIATWTDNYGGWGTQTSKGWDGDNLVLVGDYNINGQKIAARDTFEKANSTRMIHEAELQVNGEWITLQSETCDK